MSELAAVGVGRDAENACVVVVFFNRPLADRELRELHEHLRKGIPHTYFGRTCGVCDFDPVKEYEDVP